MVFDFEVALRGMGNDKALLLETLQDFIDYYADAGVKIRAAIAEKHYHDAEILAHTIKGLGGTFAAERLRDSSLELERALRDAESDGLEQKVAAFDQAVDDMVSDITHVLRS